METRTVTQVLIYKLILNPMMDRMEARRLAVLATDRQKLIDFVEQEKAPEPWRDGNWGKVFKKGSPLEWFNPPPPSTLEGLDRWGHWIESEWLNADEYKGVYESGSYPFIDYQPL
jgi:hypothetical protein